MDPSSSTLAPKETKVKIRRPRQPKTDTVKKDKPIKLKITASKLNNSYSGTNGSEEEEDDPETAIEEQLIFRVPEGELCERLHELVKKREIPEDIKLHFKDNRKGSFNFEGKKFDVQLVDLPTIIESQKTLDKKQFYKVADISQMILIDPTGGKDPFIPQTNGDPYSYPHGLTPPLKHVRQRRFRKKLSKRAIEEVEKEVERLLEMDSTAESVQYDVMDNEFDLEQDRYHYDEEEDKDIEIEDESESDSEELAAAIDREFENMDDEEEEEDEDDEDESEEEEDEEEDDEDGTQTGEIEQKRQEIAELNQAIQRKTRDLSTAPNAMLKARFETDINNLKKSLALKEAHLAEMNEKERNEKDGK